MKRMPKVTALRGPTEKPRSLDESRANERVDLSLRLLERLAILREPIGVSELAREFASSKATVYRHLQTLMLHGFVRQEATTLRYAAGIKLFILGERLRERFDVLAIARDDLARLRDETGQPATLSALVEHQVVVLEVLQGHAIVNFGTQPGTVLDLHASAHGNVALAFGPEVLPCETAQSLDAAYHLLAKCSSARRGAGESARLGRCSQSGTARRERSGGSAVQSRR
jgi:DNA-binding IclR family transcriptional regulator